MLCLRAEGSAARFSGLRFGIAVTNTTRRSSTRYESAWAWVSWPRIEGLLRWRFTIESARLSGDMAVAVT